MQEYYILFNKEQDYYSVRNGGPKSRNDAMADALEQGYGFVLQAEDANDNETTMIALSLCSSWIINSVIQSRIGDKF